MAVRVLRVLEYVYESAESYERDSAHWAVQGRLSVATGTGLVVITSRTFPFETVPDGDTGPHLAGGDGDDPAWRDNR